MLLQEPAQIMALIRSGKMINIGGRPVIVPPRSPMPKTIPSTHHRRGENLKVALAFAAIYLV